MLYYLYNTIYEVASSLLNMKTSVNEIIPNLWLGNYKTALDVDFLLDNKINMIINCTPNTPFINDLVNDKLKSEKYNNIDPINLCSIYNIETFRIPVNDSLLERDIILMEHYFKIIIPLLLKKYTTEKKNILIHCHAGKQRSAIVVTALLKVLLDNNYIELPEIPTSQCQITQYKNIYNYLLTKRPQVFSYGFRINFEKSFKRFFNIK